jgi:hypothetical protein
MNRFVVSALVVSSISTIALGQATAFRGTHVGFNTATGAAGEQLELVTGYGTGGAPESEQWAFRFATVGGQKQLQTRTARHAVDPNAPFAQASYNLKAAAPSTNVGGGTSAVAGWYANSSMAADPVTDRQTANLTSADAFVAQGKLTGGSFAWEITSVTAKNGAPNASFAIGMVTNPSGNANNALRQLKSVNTVGGINYDVFGMYDATQSGGGSLADRSIFLGNGNHFHGWAWFVSAQGEYEISMRVYDVNNKFAASESFTFLVNSIPGPSSLALIGLAGAVSARRRRN